MIIRVMVEALVEVPDSYVVHLTTGNIYIPDKTGEITDTSDHLVPVLGFWSDETDLAIAQESLIDKVWGIKLIDYTDGFAKRDTGDE